MLDGIGDGEGEGWQAMRPDGMIDRYEC